MDCVHMNFIMNYATKKSPYKSKELLSKEFILKHWHVCVMCTQENPSQILNNLTLYTRSAIYNLFWIYTWAFLCIHAKNELMSQNKLLNVYIQWNWDVDQLDMLTDKNNLDNSY